MPCRLEAFESKVVVYTADKNYNRTALQIRMLAIGLHCKFRPLTSELDGIGCYRKRQLSSKSNCCDRRLVQCAALKFESFGQKPFGRLLKKKKMKT